MNSNASQTRWLPAGPHAALPDPLSMPLKHVHWSARPLTRAALVTVAWLLLAIAWTTPTYLIHGALSTTRMSWPDTFSSLLASFVPWALATPLILHLAARFPLMRPHLSRNALIHVTAGIALIPALTSAGVLIMGRLLPLFNAEPTLAWSHFFFAVTVNAFYAIPTYAAAVGIAQAIVYLRQYRNREHLLTKARMTALRHQLNPHFLFNALNAISTLGYRDPAAADGALTTLALILRASLEDTGDKITLREEIELARSYASVYQHLLPRRLVLRESIDDNLLDVPVPRMMLQPLVENAVEHGVLNGSETVEVELLAKRLGNKVEIRVRNNGAQPGRSGMGIGLSNVSERLRLLYGNNQTLRFDWTPPGLATVTIRFPIEARTEIKALHRESA